MASRPHDPFARFLAPRGAEYRRERIVGRNRKACIALLVACAAMSLTACTESYAGVRLSPGTGDPEIRNLARLARAGDKHAQLQLGIRYEEGRGVPVDFDRAMRLYALAASGSGGTEIFYVPAGGSGPVIAVPINQGPPVPGLQEAARRLELLRARR